MDTVGHMVIAQRILPEVTGNIGRFAWMLLPAKTARESRII
jgi:hypothetical protein